MGIGQDKGSYIFSLFFIKKKTMGFVLVYMLKKCIFITVYYLLDNKALDVLDECVYRTL